MENSIISDLKTIDIEFKKLHSEGDRHRALQQQHDDDIQKQNEGVEAEYASTLAHFAGKRQN